MSKPTEFNDFVNEFDFEVPMETPPGPAIQVTLDEETEEEKAAREEAERVKAQEEAEAEKRAQLKAEGKTEEEIEAELKTARKAEEEGEQETPEEKEARLEKERLAAEAAASGSSYYKDLAAKYIEKKIWSGDIEIEIEEGNSVPISDLEDIDEDTFFQIRDAILEQEREDNKGKSISTEGLDDRRKQLVELVAEGGDLKEIFKTEKNINQFINRFDNLDLENEEVQAAVYKDALMNHNKLSAEQADVIVEQAKKDLSLDAKVQSYVENYNKQFDKFVEGQKEKLKQERAEELKKEKEFKKNLSAEYKKFDISDNLARKLTTIATSKVNGEFEIDKKYEEIMENPELAAELVLFMTDKEAYLKTKLKDNNLEVQKNVRRKIKIIPSSQKKKPSGGGGAEKPDDASEFDFVVKT